MTAQDDTRRLLHAVDPLRDHARGSGAPGGVTVVVYGDYLCPFCRRLVQVLRRLREVMGDRLVYVFRQFPNEQTRPGANLASCAGEAAGLQGRFWEMHDALFDRDPPFTRADLLELAGSLGLDVDRFSRDLDGPAVRRKVQRDMSQGRQNGVVATPTIFVGGLRYDGAWDFESMLEGLRRPVAVRVQRTARAFANLPASAGLALLLAAAGALIWANSPYQAAYHRLVATSFDIGPPGNALSLTIGNWCSEGLLAIFFLLVGLEVRRELTVGALADRRAAALPIVAALGGVLAPAAIYLLLNRGPTAGGWAVPTATDIAFVLGILALLGDRVSVGLRVFIAALAVVDDMLSIVTLAVFYSQGFHPGALAAAAGISVLMVGFNRARVYAGWPYVVAGLGLWLSLQAGGVHAALAGLIVAAVLPTRSQPAAGPLLAQAATALAALEDAEAQTRQDGEPSRALVSARDGARRSLLAAGDRLGSPAERVEQALAPWTSYIVLPLFAFSAAGVSLQLDLPPPDAAPLLAGVVLGLVVGKPLGICLAVLLAIRSGFGIGPMAPLRTFVGAACICGVGDTVSFLLADQAFPDGPYAALAKVGVLAGSGLAALIGAALVLTSPRMKGSSGLAGDHRRPARHQSRRDDRRPISRGQSRAR